MSILIFSSNGSIGSFIYNELKNNYFNYNIIKTTSNSINANEENILFVDNNNLDGLKIVNDINGIVWCHGINTNDNIYNIDINKTKEIIDVNVCFIINTLNYLLVNNKINNNASLIILSSIWENSTRDNKLSYSLSKSALSNVVKSLSYDLSFKNILINNICPGPIENEMTMQTLSEIEINNIKNYMGFDRLITLKDVWNLCEFLLFKNTGITGQSINIDLGFCSIRKYK
jgi:NAD(P)-dependent dehydrogenase (short-subunit alcohol dehydrogenase family)